MTKFEHMVACVVVRRYWNYGHSVKEIARAAKVTTRTVRRRLLATGIANTNRKVA